MVVEVIGAPWAGSRRSSGRFKRRWICRERTCRPVTFLEEGVRTRARLVRAIRWSDPTVALRGPLSRDWLDNWQPRGIPVVPTSSRACKPSDDPARFAGGKVEVDTCGITGTDRQGPVNTGMWTLAGRIIPAPWWTWSQAGLAPRMRTG